MCADIVTQIYCGFVMTFTHSSGWIESPNTRKWFGNGYPMKNYVGAVVWKSFQLVIAAEIHHFENKILVTKKNIAFS